MISCSNNGGLFYYNMSSIKSYGLTICKEGGFNWFLNIVSAGDKFQHAMIVFPKAAVVKRCLHSRVLTSVFIFTLRERFRLEQKKNSLWNYMPLSLYLSL